MPGFDNNTMYADNVDFTGSTTPSPQVSTNGQLLIGATAAPNIRVGTLTSSGGTITITPGAGTINLDLAGGGVAVDSIDVDAHTAPGTDPVVPTAGGLITVTGAQVAAGTVGANVIRTDSLAANTYTIEIQRSATNASTDSTKNGVAHFSSANFSIDSNGFVTLVTPIPGGNAWTLIDTVNVNTQASITFATGLSSYNQLMVRIMGVTWSGANIQVGFSNNGGSTYAMTGAINYSSAAVSDMTAPFVIYGSGGAHTYSGWLFMDNPTQTTLRTFESTLTDDSGGALLTMGWLDSAAQCNAIQFTLSSGGNFGTGTVTIWGK